MPTVPKTLHSQLKWLIQHINCTDEELAKMDEIGKPDVATRNQLRIYRADETAKKKLMEQFLEEIKRRDRAREKRGQERRTLDQEAAREKLERDKSLRDVTSERAIQVIDEFMKRWDGSDPRA